jgi:hypothetical protein
MVKLLLDNGADCNATQGMNYRRDRYSCALECAITIGDWGCMKLLLWQKPSFETKHILNRIVNYGYYRNKTWGFGITWELL